MKKYIIKWLGLDKQIDFLVRECAILTRDLNDERSKTKHLVDQLKLITKFMDLSTKLSDKHEQSIKKILSMIHVGMDIHDNRYGSSWCVVCLKGKEKDRDIVNFFEVKFEHYKQLKEMLKQFDMFEKKAIDLPSGLRKDFFI